MKAINFFWGVFFFTLYWVYYLYDSFIMNLLIALMLCIATFGLKTRILHIVKSEILASLLSVCFLCLILIVPVLFMVDSLVTMIKSVDTQGFSAIIEGLKAKIILWSEVLPELQVRVKEALSKVSGTAIFSWILNFSSVVGKRSLEFIVDTGFILVFLFFFYFYGLRLYEYLLNLIPFDRFQIQDVLEIGRAHV